MPLFALDPKHHTVCTMQRLGTLSISVISFRPATVFTGPALKDINSLSPVPRKDPAAGQLHPINNVKQHSSKGRSLLPNSSAARSSEARKLGGPGMICAPDRPLIKRAL